MIATEADFETQVLQAGVNVFFKPTRSHYSFFRLDGEYVSQFAPLSPKPSIRHAPQSIHRRGTLDGQRYLSLGRKAKRDGSCTQNAAEERSCSDSYRFRHCDLLIGRSLRADRVGGNVVSPRQF